MFPGQELQPLPAGHPVYHAHYDFPAGLPKIHEHDGEPAVGYGLFHEGRLVVFYASESDLGDGWEPAGIHPDPPEAREAALRMGVNLLVYAMTQGVVPVAWARCPGSALPDDGLTVLAMTPGRVLLRRPPRDGGAALRPQSRPGGVRRVPDDGDGAPGQRGGPERGHRLPGEPARARARGGGWRATCSSARTTTSRASTRPTSTGASRAASGSTSASPAGLRRLSSPRERQKGSSGEGTAPLRLGSRAGRLVARWRAVGQRASATTSQIGMRPATEVPRRPDPAP